MQLAFFNFTDRPSLLLYDITKLIVFGHKNKTMYEKNFYMVLLFGKESLSECGFFIEY